MGIDVGGYDFNDKSLFYPLNHSLPLMSPDKDQYDRL